MATTRLYRVENPNIEVDSSRFGGTSHPDLVGQWFTPDFNQAVGYARKSTQTFGKVMEVVDGAQMIIADIPDESLPSYLASSDERTAGMDIESDNYLLPRDGTIKFELVALDALLGELRGKLGVFHSLQEARRRIAEAVKNIPVIS